MADNNIQVLNDGTPITEKLVDKMVADVYSALEKGAYKVIPNPHGKSEPKKITNPLLRSELQEILIQP
jgi:hypothetical protein